MPDFSKVALIGGGSWATALVKILCENNTTVGWYVRNEVIYNHLLQEGHNPSYLSSVAFDMSTLDLHTDINKITQQYDVLIIATPSFYLDNVLAPLTVSLENKVIFSAVKGIVPEEKVLVGAYLAEKFNVDEALFWGDCRTVSCRRSSFGAPILSNCSKQQYGLGRANERKVGVQLYSSFFI